MTIGMPPTDPGAADVYFDDVCAAFDGGEDGIAAVFREIAPIAAEYRGEYAIAFAGKQSFAESLGGGCGAGGERERRRRYRHCHHSSFHA